MLLCDGCNAGAHITCLDQPLADVPEGEWFCNECAPPAAPPEHAERGLAALDALCLADELQVRVRCLQAVPPFLRGPLRAAFVTSLRKLQAAYERGEGEQQQTRCWKLFRLTARMLLWRSQERAPSRKELEARVEQFQNEEWAALVREARAAGSRSRGRARGLSEAEDLVRRAHRAETCVHRGEVSRGRQALCASALAPGTDATLRELRDPARRPPQLLEPIPGDVLELVPEHAVEFDRERYVQNVRSAPRGSAPGLAGDTNEHLKVLLDDEGATELLVCAAERLAHADVPREIVEALALGSLTALLKENGRVRGIVAGDTFRRGVARTLAQQSADAFEAACAPFQYALSTRAGTDCVARIVRALTELDQRATLLSIDGIGAFDHMRRRAMLCAL